MRRERHGRFANPEGGRAIAKLPDSKPSDHEAGYLKLARLGDLRRRADTARELLTRCVLCARRCGVDRIAENRRHRAGCRTGPHARVHSYGPHLGEEDPLRGWNGSGTIFFSECNLRCVYCQNHEISQAGHGHEVDASALARMMLDLQERGCHNINFVSPSHVVAQILDALCLAVDEGLRLPLVYNTGGYDSPKSLDLLDGVVDIYMPDMKYGDEDVARRCSRIEGYVEVNRSAVRRMHRQVGDLALDARGVARRGLLVRHLVLPGGLAGTEDVLSFLATEISPDTYVNLMDQYRPCHRATQYPPLDRAVTREEMQEAYAQARAFGLRRLDQRRPWTW